MSLSSLYSNELIAQAQTDSTSYYYNLAIKPSESIDFTHAYDFFIKQKEYYLKEQNTKKAIYYLGLIAIIQNESGFLYDSENSSIEGLSLLEKLADSKFKNASQVTFYNQIGKVNRALSNYELAINYYNKALKITSEPKHLNKLINNRGFIYIEQNKFDLALLEFEKALRISTGINDTYEIARNLDNLGYVKSKLNHKDSKKLMDSALQKRIELNDFQGIFASYKHLSEYYINIGDKKIAKSYLKKALLTAEKINSDSYKFEALSEIMFLDDDPNVVKYKELNDKIKLENLLKENKYASRKYEYQKQEEKAKANELKFQKSELEKEKEKSEKIIAFSIASLIILISIFLFFFLKSKHKKDKIKDAYLKETELSKKVHDELANDMSDLMNFVENDIEVKDTKKSLLLDNIEDIYLRTRDISTETGSIDLVNFSESIKHLLMQHNRRDTKVITNNIDTITWEKVAEHKKMVVFRCLQELMVNMKKHSNAKVVSVVFKTLNNKYEIRYVDDGIGFEKGNSNLNGLANVESRIKGIGGSFNFTTSKGNGFKAMLVFNK